MDIFYRINSLARDVSFTPNFGPLEVLTLWPILPFRDSVRALGIRSLILYQYGEVFSLFFKLVLSGFGEKDLSQYSREKRALVSIFYLKGSQ